MGTRRRPGRPRTNTAPTGSLYVRIPTKRDAKGVEFPNIPVNIPQNKLKVAKDEASKQKNKAAEDEATKQKNKDKQAVSPAYLYSFVLLLHLQLLYSFVLLLHLPH